MISPPEFTTVTPVMHTQHGTAHTYQIIGHEQNGIWLARLSHLGPSILKDMSTSPHPDLLIYFSDRHTWGLVWKSQQSIPLDKTPVRWDLNYDLPNGPEKWQHYDVWDGGREDSRLIYKLWREMEQDFAGVLTKLLTIAVI